MIAWLWQIFRRDNVAEELTGALQPLLYMGKWLPGHTVGFDGAAKNVPGHSAGSAGVKAD